MYQSKVPPHSGDDITQKHQLLNSDFYYYDVQFFPEHKRHTRIRMDDTNLELDPRTPKLRLNSTESFSCSCCYKESKEKQEEKEIRAIIEAQENPHRRMANISCSINGFEPVLNHKYDQVWSAGNFFRDKNYQKGNIFYEQPYKDI